MRSHGGVRRLFILGIAVSAILATAAEATAAPTSISLRTGGRSLQATPGAFSNPSRQLPLRPGSVVMLKINKRPERLRIRYRRAPQALYARPWRIDSGHIWAFQIKQSGRGPLALYADVKYRHSERVFSFKVRRDANARSAGFGFGDICLTDYFSWMGVQACRTAKEAGQVVLDVKEDATPYATKCAVGALGGLKLSRQPPYIKGFRPRIGFAGCVEEMFLGALGI